MTDFKKGGPLQNSNIFATNRLFVKNKLFKKRKKKRAPGVYNPTAKFKYEDGGEKDYIELDLSEEDVQKYIDGGYIVEEVTDPSIPTLNRFIDGGALNRFDNGGDTKPGVQNLSEATIYDPKTKKEQLNLFQQLKAAKNAYQDFTKQNKGKKWRLTSADNASSDITTLKKSIQLYKDELKKEQEEMSAEKAKLERLKKKLSDNKDIQNLNLKDLNTVKGKMKIEDALRNSNLDSSTVAALYKGYGLADVDVNVKRGSGPNAVYSAKETEAAAMKDVPQFVNMVSNVATAIPLAGAAGALGGAGAAILENPYVQAGLTGYGLYDATTNTLPEAYKDLKEGNYWEAAGNTALAGLDLVPGIGLAGKGAKLAGKGLGKAATKLDQVIYPTRAYRSEALAGNTGFGEQSDLAKKVFEKGDWATKSPKEAFGYLKGNELPDESTGLLGGQDMKFTEYKIPFWKKDISFDPDVAELKKLQGQKINTNEYIVPSKTALDRFLYPRRSTTIKAVPENVKTELTPTPFAPEGVPLYYPGSMPAGATSNLYASPAYKYIEDQLNAVTGHELPITHQFGSDVYPIQNYVEPQFAPNEGLGKFTRFSEKNLDDVAKANQSGTESTLNDKLSNLDAIISESLGYLTVNKKRQREIDAGNKWLKKWIDDPVTQSKIDDDFNYIAGRNNADLDVHDIAYMQAKNFTPKSKMYSLKKQLKDYVKGKETIHSGNAGVSYLHGINPLYKWDFETGVASPSWERYGSWISRSPFLKNQTNTTIHEGTHDWVDEFTLTNSLQDWSIRQTLSDDKLKNLHDWETLRNQGKDPAAILGKKKANEGYLSNPTEIHARIMELRKDFGLTPKTSTEVTPSQAEEMLKKIKKGKTSIDKEFANVVDNNPDKLAFLFKRLWAAPVAITGTGAAATMMTNPFQGSDGLQQQKKGGSTNDYIEIDIPEEEIQKYIAQGYIVEPVSKLKKFIS